MTGQAAQNIENLLSLANEGLTFREAAARLDLCVPYVKLLAKNHGINLVADPSIYETLIENVRQLAAQGLTRQEAANHLRLHYGTIVKCAIEHDIRFIHANFNPSPTIRTRQMAALYRNGKTLHKIGTQYGITRERVRQLITKFHGLSAQDGGQHKVSKDKRAIFEAKRNARSLKRWGCNFDQYIILKNLKKPTRAYAMQRRNARTREIGWELNLYQWWSIWQQSGHWAKRGRGQGYVMCRTGDVGPYSIDNVFIAPARENSSKQARNKSGLPIGVKKKSSGFEASRSINGKLLHLGTHSTPELAHAAYLSAEATQ